MHIVFMVGNYYPNHTAVSKCVSNVAEELAKFHDVTIICEKNFASQSSVDEYRNQKIFRFITVDTIKRENILSKIKSSSRLISKLFEIKLLAYRIIQAIKVIISKDSIKYDLVNAYEQQLYKLITSIDVIIPTSLPYETVVAATNFKVKSNESILLIPYLFDQFVENRALHRLQINRKFKKNIHKKIELNVLKNSNQLILLNQLFKFYDKNYMEYKSKFHYVEHPLIVKSSFKIYEKKSNLSFLYAGSFYMKIRNPEYMLRIFDKILIEVKGILTLYTFGNCGKIINKYSKLNELIKNYGSVTSNVVVDEMIKSDFLIAVGNTDNTQVPSKIYEYISLGKPILYFYSIDDDENLKALLKYPLSLCLKQSYAEFDLNCSKIIEFIKNNSQSHIDFELITRLYPEATPDHTVDLIKKFMKDT